MHLENSQKNHLKKKVWRMQNLQTHLFLKKMNWRKKNKLRGSEVLKISNVQVQTHFLLKTMDTKKKNPEIEIESRLGSKSRKGFSRTKFCYTKTII